MKMTFLGTGSFFAGPGNYHSNILLEAKTGKRLLLDCGSDIRHSLGEAGYSHGDINAVYISHPHDDHVGGLEWLGYAHYFIPKQGKPQLFAHASLIDPIWVNRLKISMEALTEKTAKLSDYFTPIRVQNAFNWESIKFRLVPGIHVINHALGHMYSFGLFFTLNRVKVYWTSDITYSARKVDPEAWDIDEHYENLKKADIIFHDCETVNQSEVHPHYNLLKELPKDIKKKMWLYHTQSANVPDAKKDGFLGIVSKGQEFKFQ